MTTNPTSPVAKLESRQDLGAATGLSISTDELRRVCMCCKRDLPGSVITSTVVSHGLCNPLCDEAKAFGYGAYLKQAA
jgi:hypothetical protein